MFKTIAVFIGLTALFGYMAIWGIRGFANGSIPTKFGVLHRRTEPIGFWILTSISILIPAIFLLCAVIVLFRKSS